MSQQGRKHRQLYTKTILGRVFLTVLGLAAFTIGTSCVVWALSNDGPDSGDFPGSAYFTLSDTHDVQGSTAMGITVYHSDTKPGSSVRISVNYQPGSGQCLQQNNQGYAGVHFSYGTGKITGDHYGERQTAIDIPAAAWSAQGQGYSVHIDGNLLAGMNSCNGGNDGNHVNFKLAAPSGYLLGPDAGYNLGIAQGSYCVRDGKSCNGYTDYTVPFAPSCSVMTGGAAAVKIYDMDNDGQHDIIQPSPLIHVKVIDTTSGDTVNNDSYTGSEANAGTAEFGFSYQPHHSYKLEMDSVNKNNILQISLPFDSINAGVQCLTASCGPTTLSDYLAVGVETSFTVSFKFSGSTDSLHSSDNPPITLSIDGPSTPAGSHLLYRGPDHDPVAWKASDKTITSEEIQFTPTEIGTYKLTYGIPVKHDSATSSDGVSEETTSCGYRRNTGGPGTFTVAYAPYFSLLGGDSSAGPGFGAGCHATAADIIGLNTQIAPDYSGAGSQLAALANGELSGFVTAQPRGGTYAAGARPPSGLSFANTHTKPLEAIYGGSFHHANWCLPDYAGAAATTAGTHTLSATTVTTADMPVSGTYSLAAGSNVHVALSGLPAGRRIVLLVRMTGTGPANSVIIDNDIPYGGYNSIDTIPQFQLIVQGGNILVDNTVGELHGVYTAQPKNGIGGSLYTCAVRGAGNAYTTSTDYRSCGKQLQIYGSVSVAHLYLGRSSGTIGTDVPAEQIEYSPELWMPNDTGVGSRLQTTSITSLPPQL